MVALCAGAGLLNYADSVNMSVCIVPLGDALGYGVGERATALAAFFWDYVPARIFAALAARRLGAKIVLAAGATGWSLFTFLTPEGAKHGLVALAACGAAMGACEGAAFPAVLQVFAERVPAERRAAAIVALTTGKALGTTLALVTAPIIVTNIGWEAVFQIFGAAGGVWVVSWWLLAKDTSRPPPEVLATLGSQERAALGCILRMPACYAQVASQFLASAFHYTVLSWLPTYLSAVHKLAVGDAWYAFIPYAAAALAAPLRGILSDTLAGRGDVARARKTTTTMPCVRTTVFMLAFSRAQSIEEALFVIACCLACFALNAGGFESAYLDIAKTRYVALFKSIANTMGAASGAVAVKAVSTLLAWSGDWRVVFAAQAGWVSVAALVYCTPCSVPINHLSRTKG